MARHAAHPEPEPPPVPEMNWPALMRALTFIVVAVNAAAGMSLLAVGQPGASPSLQLLASLLLPLPAWSVAPLSAAVLLSLRYYVAGHTVALPLWLLLAIGAVYGLVTARTNSAAASLILAALVTGMAAFHAVGLGFRRRASSRR